LKEAVISELANVPLFKHLDKNELDQLEALTEKKRFPARTTIFFQDDPSDALYIMLSGSVKLYQTSEDGRERIMRIVNRGNAFGELAMIEGKSRFVSAQALEDTDALRLARKDFVEFADKHTWVLWTLLSALAERVLRMNTESLDLSFRDVPYRVLHALSELIGQNGVAGPDGWRISTPLSVRDLASMVGSNVETVGRLLDRFEADDVIKRDTGHVIVRDPKALARTLEYTAQSGV
jgi:CRP-like cAMP-binding protein